MPSSPDQHAPQRERNDDQMEFKPVVKYAAIGLAVAALLGVEYATYRVGFSNGYVEGVNSGEVSETVNVIAVDNLRHFMQISTADEASLLETVRNRETTLAWITEPSVRLEAEWTLAQALITRGLTIEAHPMLQQLLPAEQQCTDVWLRRSLLAARALVEEKHYAEAEYYYRYAEAYYTAQKNNDALVSLIAERLAYLPTFVKDDTELHKALTSYAKQAAQLGPKGKELYASLLSWKGRLYREKGTPEALQKANKCFELALREMDTTRVPELAGASVCVAALLIDKGETERAAELLRDALTRLGDNPSGAPYMLQALRDLARIEQDKGNVDAALALLYRAEGVALTHESPQSAFWNCLYDQRAWLNLLKGNPAGALIDFENALSRSGELPILRAQPLEGAARSCIATGEIDKAATYLTECVEIRKTHFANDPESLGRAALLLGQVHDMRGEVQEAVSMYGLAADLLPAEENEAGEDRVTALFAKAYALAQLRKWTESATVWNDLQHMLPKDSKRRREVADQLEACKLKGAVLPDEVDAEESTDDQS